MNRLFRQRTSASSIGIPLLLAGSLVLTACGGGGGDSSPASTLAVADAYDVGAGVARQVSAADGVLVNDDGEALVATLITAPARAESFTLNPDGSFSYRAEADNKTSDQFVYQVQGSDGLTSSATVSLTIFPPPLAVADAYIVAPGQALTVSADDGVLANDESERQTLSATLVQGPAMASAFSLNKDGSFNYTATAAAAGTDTFRYTLNDGLQASAAQSVSIRIDSGVLSGQDDSFSVESGKALSLSGPLGILKNDDGTSGATISVRKLPEQAIDFQLAADGELIYRTVSTSATQDSFSYMLSKDGETLGPFAVSLSITQPALGDEPPGAFDYCTEYNYSQSTVSGTLAVPGVSNPTFELLSQPRLGTLDGFDPASGQFSYQRSSAARGQDSFSYRVFDDNGDYLGDASVELIATPYRVMPVGDSITSGVEFYDSSINQDTPSSDVRVGYRKFLKDRLTAEGYSIDLVGSRNEGYAVSGFSDTQHNGYPGQTTGYVRDNMASWLNATGADIILMHIGTNSTPDNINDITSIANTIDNWESNANNPAALMLAKLIQRTDSVSRADRIIAFNRLIESFVPQRKATGDRIALVDQFEALGDGEYLSADRLHPDAEGYQVMSNVWISRLKETGVLKKCE
ncbi:MAG: cadherin-like domain-containing protein [Gammaproteobacteria bacterium]|nr:cadherin-like domain-containing protein [Gammaproteobacteria bacterium]